jgi:hypothetical protein
MPNTVCSDIAAVYTNRRLRKVVNVYQTQFLDFKASGLGDYIRGSLTMLQLLRTLRKYTGHAVEFDMDLRNHPMGKWLITDTTLEVPVSYPTLGNFHIDSLLVEQDENDIAFQHILRETVRYFNKVSDPVFFAYSCKEHIFSDILESEKALIRSKLQPTQAMEVYIGEALASLSLVAGNYEAIHVRLDDAICFPHAREQSQAKMTTKLLTDVVAAVYKVIDPGRPYVLLSSNTEVKTALSANTNIHFLNTAICHIGQNQSQTEAETRDTLLDFFLMSRATAIHAFTTYQRTGFSLECSKVYGIPYTVTVV